MTQSIGNRARAIQRRMGGSVMASRAKMGNRYRHAAVSIPRSPPREPVIANLTSAVAATASTMVLATRRLAGAVLPALESLLRSFITRNDITRLYRGGSRSPAFTGAQGEIPGREPPGTRSLRADATCCACARNRPPRAGGRFLRRGIPAGRRSPPTLQHRLRRATDPAQCPRYRKQCATAGFQLQCLVRLERTTAAYARRRGAPANPRRPAPAPPVRAGRRCPRTPSGPLPDWEWRTGDHIRVRTARVVIQGRGQERERR